MPHHLGLITHTYIQANITRPSSMSIPSVLHQDDHPAFFGKVAKMIFSADDIMGEITQTTRVRGAIGSTCHLNYG